MNSHLKAKLENFSHNFSLLFFCSLAFIAVLEISFRLLVSWSPFIGTTQLGSDTHRPRPYVEAVASNRLEGINSLGYKGKLPLMPKPADEFRIAILGGSNIFGESPQEEIKKGHHPLPIYLEKELKNIIGPSVEVYNFGIISTVAQQELTRLTIDVISFEPDLVISYTGGNDFKNFHDNRIGYPHRYIYHEFNPVLIPEINEYPAFHLMAFGSQVLRYFLRTQFEQFFNSLRDPEIYEVKGIDYYTTKEGNLSESLSRMNKISQAYNANFVAYFQPLRSFQHGSEDKIRIARSFAENTSVLAQEKGMKNFILMLDVLKDHSASEWKDSIHPSDKVNRFLANWLAKDLEKHISISKVKGD